MKCREGDQPLPNKTDNPAIQDLLIADIEKRKEIGIQRYGTLLTGFNGRNMFRDAFEEVLDLAVYLRGVQFEREVMRQAVTDLYADLSKPNPDIDDALNKTLLLLEWLKK